MIDEASFWNILIDEMAVELSCTTPDCALGPGGIPYKTPALEPALAMEMLNNHRADAHGACAAGGGEGAAQGKKKPHLSKLPRPTIT